MTPVGVVPPTAPLRALFPCGVGRDPSQVADELAVIPAWGQTAPPQGVGEVHWVVECGLGSRRSTTMVTETQADRPLAALFNEAVGFHTEDVLHLKVSGPETEDGARVSVMHQPVWDKSVATVLEELGHGLAEVTVEVDCRQAQQ